MFEWTDWIRSRDFKNLKFSLYLPTKPLKDIYLAQTLPPKPDSCGAEAERSTSGRRFLPTHVLKCPWARSDSKQNIVQFGTVFCTARREKLQIHLTPWKRGRPLFALPPLEAASEQEEGRGSKSGDCHQFLGTCADAHLKARKRGQLQNKEGKEFSLISDNTLQQEGFKVSPELPDLK